MPHFPRRAATMTPESYRRAAVRLRRMADRIEAHADTPERLTGPIQRLLAYVASLQARHHVALAGRPDASREPGDVPGQAYCSLCERWVVPTGNGGDLVCPTHTTYVL